MAANGLKCYLCDLVTGLDFKSFFYHLKIFHNVTDISLEYKCGYPNCNKITQTKKGIREHMMNCKLKNSETLNESFVRSNNNDTNNTDTDNNSINLKLESASRAFQFRSVAQSQTNDIDKQMKCDFIDQMKCNIVSLVGRLNCKMIPNSTIDFIIADIKNLLNSIFLFIRSNFLTSNKDFLDTYLEYVSFQNIILSEIDTYSTAYKRRKLALDNVPGPREVTLGVRFDRQFDKNLQAFIEKPISDTMVYISLTSSLKYLLQNKTIQNYIAMERPANDDGTYNDITDGSFIKTSEFYNSDEKRLLIQIYVDDFEPVNGMGYKTGIHKTTPVYFILRNLPLHFQSKLKNINLLALVNAQDTKFYGYNNILYCIVQDLQFLEQSGVEVEFLNGQKHIKGSLAAICGDNLGSNGICGLQECFSTGKFCRQCLIDYDNISEVVEESQVELRTKSNYESDVEASQATGKIVNGVKAYCILNQLNNFHVIDAPTVDPMHDILEGVGQWSGKEFISFIVSAKLLTEQQINAKIAAFNFGQQESSSLPNSISYTKQELGLKAAPAWCFIRHIPLIFKNLFENTNNKELMKRCKLVRLINSIMLIVFSPCITETMRVNLGKLIKEHHLLQLKIRPNSLKPKHHLIIHYPTTILKMGPLIGLCCMRFEGKHLPFKKQAQSCQNFVNVCKSFAFRHQEAVYFSDKSDEKLTYQVLKEPIDTDHINHLLEPFSPRSELVFVSSLSKIRTFRKGFFVCVDVDPVTKNPIFNEIREMFIYKGEGYFILSAWKTIKFDEKLNAYQISKLLIENLKICHSDTLHYFAPFNKLFIDNFHFIVPEHIII